MRLWLILISNELIPEHNVLIAKVSLSELLSVLCVYILKISSYPHIHINILLSLGYSLLRICRDYSYNYTLVILLH